MPYVEKQLVDGAVRQPVQALFELADGYDLLNRPLVALSEAGLVPEFILDEGDEILPYSFARPPVLNSVGDSSLTAPGEEPMKPPMLL